MTDYPFLDRPDVRNMDTLPVRATTADLIDMDKVARHIQAAINSGRYRDMSNPMEYLLQKKCLVVVDGETYATPAGILCFGRNPQEIFPRAVIDLGHWRGVEAISEEVRHLKKDIGGTLFDQLKYLEDYIWENTKHGAAVSGKSYQRVELHEYPLVVVRELGVNMVAHRDFTNYWSSCRVQIFRDRIEWISPGGLPEGVTVENLLVAQFSRNPTILRILYEAGYVEGFGLGFDTVFRTLREEGLPPPEFQDAGGFFLATVFGRPEEDFAALRAQVLLNDRQALVMQLLRGQSKNTGLSFLEMREALDIPERSLYRELDELEAAGLITTSGKARAKRFRLREPGN